MDEMERFPSEVELPESLAAYGTPKFNDVLQDELVQQADNFDLEEAMQHGGSADTDDVEFGIERVIDKPKSIIVKGSIYFSESARRSGCANLGMQSHAHRGVFKLRLRKRSGKGTIEIGSFAEVPDDQDDDDLSDEPDIHVDDEK